MYPQCLPQKDARTQSEIRKSKFPRKSRTDCYALFATAGIQVATVVNSNMILTLVTGQYLNLYLNYIVVVRKRQNRCRSTFSTFIGDFINRYSILSIDFTSNYLSGTNKNVQTRTVEIIESMRGLRLYRFVQSVCTYFKNALASVGYCLCVCVCVNICSRIKIDIANIMMPIVELMQLVVAFGEYVNIC